jgi:hypothetical protein
MASPLLILTVRFDNNHSYSLYVGKVKSSLILMTWIETSNRSNSCIHLFPHYITEIKKIEWELHNLVSPCDLTGKDINLQVRRAQKIKVVALHLSGEIPSFIRSDICLKIVWFIIL